MATSQDLSYITANPFALEISESYYNSYISHTSDNSHENNCEL